MSLPVEKVMVVLLFLRLGGELDRRGIYLACTSPFREKEQSIIIFSFQSITARDSIFYSVHVFFDFSSRGAKLEYKINETMMIIIICNYVKH